MKDQKGITLVALIITIIVMLILVTVSVTVALNSNLFSTAQTATRGTNEAYQAERNFSSGEVNVAGGTYSSVQEYVDSLKNGNALSANPTHVLSFDGKAYKIDQTTTWQQFFDTFEEGAWIQNQSGTISYSKYKTAECDAELVVINTEWYNPTMIWNAFGSRELSLENSIVSEFSGEQGGPAGVGVWKSGAYPGDYAWGTWDEVNWSDFAEFELISIE